MNHTWILVVALVAQLIGWAIFAAVEIKHRKHDRAAEGRWLRIHSA